MASYSWKDVQDIIKDSVDKSYKSGYDQGFKDGMEHILKFFDDRIKDMRIDIRNKEFDFVNAKE